MKKHISKMILIFAVLQLLFCIVCALIAVCDEVFLHMYFSLPGFSSLLSNLGTGIFFLGLYRIIDLLEEK